MLEPSVTQSVWKEFHGDLFSFIRRRVATDEVAEDLLQDAFLKVHRRIGDLRESERLAAWVYRIVRNVIYDYYRQTDSVESIASVEQLADLRADQPPRDIGADWLTGFVGQLPDLYRDAVRLAEVEQLPHKEVAKRLELTLAATKSRIRRGRELLKTALDECCEFRFDRRGNLIDCEPRSTRRGCRECDSDSTPPCE